MDVRVYVRTVLNGFYIRLAADYAVAQSSVLGYPQENFVSASILTGCVHMRYGAHHLQRVISGVRIASNKTGIRISFSS